MTKVASFEVEYSRFLDPAGGAVAPLPGFAQDPEELVPMYRAMVLSRTFDAKAIAMQRTGRLGTFASILGQEAVGVGLASAMRPDDVLVPSFRETAAQIVRGVSLCEAFLHWGGDGRGNDFAGPREDFPASVPVGTHAPHAVGIALAFMLRGEARAAVCVFGDGATSKGDVAEALNLAGVWRLPAVFVINNNQWAISVSRQAQTAAETLAQKAIAAGIPGEQVDGNDVIAVRHATAKALAKAYSGGGAHLIEALTYRMGDHTTADDARRYRDDAEVSKHWREDPIARLRQHPVAAGVWDKAREEELIGECTAEVDAAAEEYLAIPPEPVEAMFDYLFASLPPALAAQREAAIREAEADA